MDWILENWFGLTASALLILVTLHMFVISPLRINKSRKKSLERLENESLADSEEPPVKEIHGRVIKKHCYTDVIGMRSVRAYTNFHFIFLTDDGETLRYDTDEQTYLTIEENREGTIAIVGDRFYGFCPD